MTAVYARQSVEKEGSISIATQIGLCRARAGGEEVRVFCDEGFTGANLQRPGFQALMQAAASGEIDRVIVYKLDRISRSLLDFARIIEDFDRYGVKFISLNEEFDTATAMGRAMLGVVMIFAQLERETTQKRVKDAFYARMRQGFFVSGVAPVGFVKVPHSIDGIRTMKLSPDPAHVPLIGHLYRAYEAPLASLGMLVREINADPAAWGLEKPVTSVRIRRILRNPVYVRADVQVYRYLQEKGAEMADPPEAYDGTHGCTVYGSRRQGAKFTDLHGDIVKLGFHEGLIPAAQWLCVQEKLDSNRQLRNAGKGQHSWLSGIVKCGCCGYALTVVSGGRSTRRRASCTGRRMGICQGTVLSFDALEQAVESELLRYLAGFRFASLPMQDPAVRNRIRLELQRCRQAQRSVTDKLLAADSGAFPEIMAVLEEELGHLRREEERLQAALSRTSAAESRTEETIRRYLAGWETLPLEEKKAAARLFLREVRVTDAQIILLYHTERPAARSS